MIAYLATGFGDGDVICTITAYLRQSNAYPGDWYRWMGGQAGHAAIIGGSLGLPGLVSGCPIALMGVFSGSAYWLV